MEDTSVENEFVLKWDKHLSYLTLNDITTKATLKDNTLYLQKQNKILGIIKGKITKQKIPLSNIERLSIRKKINLFDILLGLTFLVLTIGHPLFLVFAIITFWTGISTKIIITTNLNSKFMISTDSKDVARKLIEAINEINIHKTN